MTEDPKSTQKRKEMLGSLAERCVKAEAEVERLRAALEWYAASRIELIVAHTGGMCSVPHRIEFGDRARQALAAEGEKP